MGGLKRRRDDKLDEPKKTLKRARISQQTDDQLSPDVLTVICGKLKTLKEVVRLERVSRRWQIAVRVFFCAKKKIDVCQLLFSMKDQLSAEHFSLPELDGEVFNRRQKATQTVRKKLRQLKLALQWLSSRAPGVTDVGPFSVQNLYIAKNDRFPRGATIGSGRLRRGIVDEVDSLKKLTVLRYPTGVLMHKQLLELARGMAERLVVLHLGDVKPLRKFGLSKLMAQLTSLRELQWLQAKANVLNHITAPDQLRSLQLTFVTWEEGSEIFLERCTELRSLALSVVEESEKTALSRSWRNRRPSGRDCHLLRYLPNLVKFQLNVAPRLLFQKLSKHCKLIEYVAIGEDIGDDVTHPPGLDDVISSLDKLESLSLPSVRRLSLRMSVDYGQHPPQMMPILLNRIVTTFPNLEELKVDIAVGVSNISLDWSSFTSKLSILGNLVKLTIRLDTQTGSVGKLWRHLPTSVESVKLIIARPMKGLRSSVMDLIRGLGDWNRFPELTSLSLYAPGVDTVELLKAIEENCDLTTVNVVGELGNSNGSAILTALKSLATACPRVRSVGLGVDHLRQLSDEDWSKVPFAQLRPLFDYIQSANDNDDDSWDEDNRPKKCRRLAFVDDDDASHDEAANHDDVTSHEDEDEYESDFVVSDDQVSFETDASLSSEFDEGEL